MKRVQFPTEALLGIFEWQAVAQERRMRSAPSHEACILKPQIRTVQKKESE